MKPDSVKCLLNHYLREKLTKPVYDEIDGITARCGMESFENVTQALEELHTFHPERAGLHLQQLHYEPLSPQAEESAREFGRQLSQMSDEFEVRRSRSSSLESQPDSGKKCVQFKCRCVFASPSDSKVNIDIIRVGNIEDAVKVSYETKDKTAKSGVHYHGNSGDISFAEGETEKTIQIEIVKNQRDRNICFTVNLLSSEDLEIGSGNPMTVYIADHSNFVQSERQVVNNIMNCPPDAPVSEVAICLSDDLTPNTFRTALQYRCSFLNSIPHELAFAFELVNISVGKKLSLETLGDIVSKFFSYVPELEDLTEAYN